MASSDSPPAVRPGSVPTPAVHHTVPPRGSGRAAGRPWRMADVANADDLYGLAPGEFVAARDALARRLRAEGDREQAAVVKALRRPSATAAALNLAARQHPELLEQALDAGEQLRGATEDALAGEAGGLRAATAEERAASGRFLTAAEAFLGSPSPDARQRMGATLRAALLEGEVLDALQRGVLAADHEPAGAGFGLGGASTVAPRPKPRTKKAASRKTGADDDVAAAQRRRELIAAVARLEKAWRARAASAEKAVARAERAAAAAHEAEAAAVEARAAAEVAAEGARTAQAAVDDAADELARARTELDDQR